MTGRRCDVKRRSEQILDVKFHSFSTSYFLISSFIQAKYFFKGTVIPLIIVLLNEEIVQDLLIIWKKETIFKKYYFNGSLTFA